jgi:type VI secretion system protein ImpL
MGTWSGVSNDVGSAAGGLWEVSVWEGWRNELEPKFPFQSSLGDAKLETFVDFFRPKTGALWSFYDENLKGAVKQVGDNYVATRRFDSTASYNGDFLSGCLARGREITDAFFPAGSDVPKIDFQVNLHTVSRNVSEVSVSIDGVSHVYKNTPEEWLSGTWPAAEGAPGAHVRIQGADGLDEEIIREGEFGFFRMIQAATKLEEGSADGAPAGVSTLIATYDFPSEKAFLQLDIRT